ncbi:transposase (plasmid) [Hymenobacter sp. BRD128]|nr:transposase [Hymenobacter sp. BRD128]
MLTFRLFCKNQDSELGKIYRAASRDCRLCPRKPTCVPKVKKQQYIRTAYAAHYRRTLTRQGRYIRRLRQRTIEPVFGTLLQHYGLRRVNQHAMS